MCKLAGLDVVDAVRRLGALSQAFAYSLAGQLFVERADAVLEAKNLNTLSLGGAAAAIRTHGPGLAVAAHTRTASFLTGRLCTLAQVGTTLHSISSPVPRCPHATFCRMLVLERLCTSGMPKSNSLWLRRRVADGAICDAVLVVPTCLIVAVGQQ